MIKIRFFQSIFSQNNLKTLAICYIATINMVEDSHSGQTTDWVDNKYIKWKDGRHTPHTAPKHPKDPPEGLNNVTWTHSLLVVNSRREPGGGGVDSRFLEASTSKQFAPV